MIRLTLHAKSEPEIHLFNKSTILIGSEAAEEVDIVLPHLHLELIHVKIVEQDGFFTITNVAHDPFVSLNNHPFGKKLIRNGDIIAIHDVEIVFENLESSLTTEASISQEASQETPASLPKSEANSQGVQAEAQPAIPGDSPSAKQLFLDLQLPFENDVEPFRNEEWQLAEADDYLKETEIYPPPLTDQNLLINSPTPSIKNEERKKTKSLKDDYLKEFDDDNNAFLSPGLQPTEQNHLYHAWKWIIFFIFSILTITAIVGTVIYLTVSDNTEAQETKVAQGMADIAMALMHAQLNHVKPPNQNWSDIDFIKSNLQAILSESHSHASRIDVQGQFNCCAYSLRIYTNSDLSHFLLIAQPGPSLLQWLIPKSVILVDSQAMELRAVKDLRSLNRLLANPDPLEGVNGKEIYALVKQGELIRLSSLASEGRHTDFIPPRNLAWMKPGTENFIYNAPRYYRLGQALIQKAIALTTSKGTSQEVSTLKQEIESFGRLNGLVLYADQGKNSAILTQRGILTFAPSDKILFGYLVFNAQGKIQQAYLLKEEDLEEASSLALATYKEKEEEPIALQIASDKSYSDKLYKEEKAVVSDEESKQIDTNHPIYIQLISLAHARENELKSLAVAMNTLLNEELHTPTLHFQEEFQNLTYQYLMTDMKHKEKIKEALSLLYYQYDEMPITQFISFAKQAGFGQLIQQNGHSFTLRDENCIQNLEIALSHIENAKSLIELDNLIHMACSWLTFDYMKNSQELLKYQNLLRNQVLSQLEKLLLSYRKHLELPHLKVEERETLQHILTHERLIQPDEREYFLQEFDYLFDQDPSPPYKEMSS